MFPSQVNPSPAKPERQEHVTSTPAIEQTIIFAILKSILYIIIFPVGARCRIGLHPDFVMVSWSGLTSAVTKYFINNSIKCCQEKYIQMGHTYDGSNLQRHVWEMNRILYQVAGDRGESPFSPTIANGENEKNYKISSLEKLNSITWNYHSINKSINLKGHTLAKPKRNRLKVLTWKERVETMKTSAKDLSHYKKLPL